VELCSKPVKIARDPAANTTSRNSDFRVLNIAIAKEISRRCVNAIHPSASRCNNGNGKLQ